MSKSYSDVAGRDLGRVAALSDGVFAVALTLLILDIHVPQIAAATDSQVLDALVNLAPRFLTYALSFLTLGIFWNAQHTQMTYLARTNRDLTWLNLVFLGVVVLVPFWTSLLSSYIDLRLPLIAYWLNIVILGLLVLLTWEYARRAGLLRPDVGDDVDRAIKRRIYIARALYAFGAALVVISP